MSEPRPLKRLFYASERSPTTSAVKSEIWRENLYKSLAKIIPDVVEFDYDLDAVSQLLASGDADPTTAAAARRDVANALTAQLADARRGAPVDALFTYFTSRHCDPQTIRDIGNSGIVTLNWYCNASYQFDLVQEIAPAYSYCLVAEKDRLDTYRSVGANPVYCPEAANPDVYGPRAVREEYDVAFVGQRYGDRPQWIKYLLDQRIAVRVWGPGWRAENGGRPGAVASSPWSKARGALKRHGPGTVMAKIVDRLRYRVPDRVLGGTLSDAELVQMYSRARISLGLATVGDTHRGGKRILQVRLRDIEALMSGAFYITEYQEDLAQMFEADKEVVFYRSREELLDKIRFYLKRDDLRAAIRKGARRRALADHTWQHRFATVFRQIGLL